MFRSLPALAAALAFISDASAVALPQASSANAVSQVAASAPVSPASSTSAIPQVAASAAVSPASSTIAVPQKAASNAVSPSSANALSVLCAAITTSPLPSGCTPTTTTTTPTPSVSAAPFCINYAVPQACTSGVDYCQCSNGDFSITSGDNPCPWTTDPPASLTYTTPTCQTSTAAPAPTVPAACASGVTPSDSTASCWDDLQLTDYVNSWWSSNSGNCAGTVSHPSEDGDPTTSFANCWYKIVVPAINPSICDVLSTGSSCKEPSWGDFTGDDLVQQFWVTWAIFNLNQWFTSLNTAIIAAGSEVEGITGKIETTFNPPEVPSTPVWEYILDALTFATSLWAEGSEITKAIVRAIPQGSTLITKVYPQGQVEGVVTQWSDLEGQISTFIKNWGDDIGNGIELALNDETQFVALAEAGQFTGGVFDLSGLTDSIYTVLGTYLASITAQATNYIITRTAGQSIAEIQATTQLQWDSDCDNGYDSVGICGPWYYDGSDTYSLVNQQKWQADESNLMSLLFEGNGGTPLADVNLFFTGSLLCSQVPGNPNGGGKPSLSSDYTSFNCVANNRVCTWAWQDSDLQNGIFLPDCTGDDLPSVFDFNCGTGVYDNFGKCAPFAYFGPGIESTYNDKLCHTNCGGGNVS